VLIYPIQAVSAMSKINESAESSINFAKRFHRYHLDLGNTHLSSICNSAVNASFQVDAKAIVCVTNRGITARMISAYRPACPIIAAVLDEKSYRQLALSWGVYPVKSEMKYTTDDILSNGIEIAKSTGLVNVSFVCESYVGLDTLIVINTAYFPSTEHVVTSILSFFLRNSTTVLFISLRTARICVPFEHSAPLTNATSILESGNIYTLASLLSNFKLSSIFGNKSAYNSIYSVNDLNFHTCSSNISEINVTFKPGFATAASIQRLLIILIKSFEKPSQLNLEKSRLNVILVLCFVDLVISKSSLIVILFDHDL
jgi:hypothetical protein